LGKILVGISGWADPGLLRSGFYPVELKTGPARLRYYAANFPLVEMDSSYHVIPGRRNVAAWLAAVPAGFVFNLKAFSLFTHHPTALTALPRDLLSRFTFPVNRHGKLYVTDLDEKQVDALWERFVAAIEPFKSTNHLGVVFFQFSPWFVPKPENLEYLVRCKNRLSGMRMAVEFRRPAWLDHDRQKATLDLLKKNAIILICVDEPQGFATSVPPVVAVTSEISIVRFHGRNALTWEKNDVQGERYAYLYSEQELSDWIPRIRLMAAQTADLHLIFKNKYLDYEVRNARQMQEMLRRG
jgi:uncharacterized protein YecE (DUF72 family)